MPAVGLRYGTGPSKQLSQHVNAKIGFSLRKLPETPALLTQLFRRRIHIPTLIVAEHVIRWHRNNTH